MHVVLLAARCSLLAARCSLLAALTLSFLPDVARSQATGQWQQGYLHPTNGLLGWPTTFEAVNLAVVPNISTTSNSNDIVIAWDLNPAQPWPVTPTPGYYMMFLVTTEGTPSKAKWVRVS